MARRVKSSSTLSHLSPEGSARMVDVGAKAETVREAVARGFIEIKKDALDVVRRGGNKKGDVVETARVAGILGAKRTAELVPLCHPLALDYIDVTIEDRGTGLEIEARVRSRGRTGVEMEALTAVSVAALTVYDMVKSADKTMEIGKIRLIEKRGGRSGHFVRKT